MLIFISASCASFLVLASMDALLSWLIYLLRFHISLPHEADEGISENVLKSRVVILLVNHSHGGEKQMTNINNRMLALVTAFFMRGLNAGFRIKVSLKRVLTWSPSHRSAIPGGMESS